MSGVSRALVLALLCVAVSGCSVFNRWFDKDDPIETMPVEELYAEAKGSLTRGNIGRAQNLYKRLVARFPYGPLTEQAQLELAYAYYRANRADDAIPVIDRFIRTYPTHPAIDYAYYLRGLVNMGRPDTALARLARTDDTARDQASVRQAFNDFSELVNRYPNSRYAGDARSRMMVIRDKLATADINVAAFYLRRGAWVAAVNRAQFVLEQYPNTSETGNALAVMSEAYTRLGQETLAADARRVLVANDPQHPYLDGAWPKEESWWRKLLPLAGERD